MKILLNFFSFLLIHVLSNSAFCQTSIPNGLVSGNWTNAGSPYLINGTIQIPKDSTLVIQPGVKIIFNGHYKLIVQGRILAIGNATDSITFSPNDTISGWAGIRFDNTPSTNDTSKFRYCNLKYGKATGVHPDDYGGLIYINSFSKILITNCIIMKGSSDTGGGIYCLNSSLSIQNCTIKNNISGTGGAIAISSNGIVTVSNNVIYNNEGTYGGGGIYIQGSSASIKNNIIYKNTSSAGGGAGIGCFGGNLFSITNNIITNNSSWSMGGGLHFNGSSPKVTNNVICNNYSANPIGSGGVHCESNSNPILQNNTIVNNLSIRAGGLYCRDNSNPVVSNTIIWGNKAAQNNSQVFLELDNSDPTFIYCNIQGGLSSINSNNNIYLGTFSNNLNANPLFVLASDSIGLAGNGQLANWSLQGTSPCVDSGNPQGNYLGVDIAENPRLSGIRVDIGAYEFQNPTEVEKPDFQNQIEIFPNPISNHFTINVSQSFLDEFFEVFDITGKRQLTGVITGTKTKVENIDFNPGVYILSIGGKFQKRLIIY